MTLKEVKKYFGSARNLAAQLGLTRQAWYNWIMIGYVPIGSQVQIEEITKGKLKADLKDTIYAKKR